MFSYRPHIERCKQSLPLLGLPGSERGVIIDEQARISIQKIHYKIDDYFFFFDFFQLHSYLCDTIQGDFYLMLIHTRTADTLSCDPRSIAK